MRDLLQRAGASFLRAFFASILVLAPGILAAPNLNQGKALGIAALCSSLAAGFKALQVFVPQLTFKTKLGEVAGTYVDSFTRAFLGAFLTLSLGILDAPNLDNARALGAAALVGGFAAGIRALQGLFTKGEPPGKTIGG